MRIGGKESVIPLFQHSQRGMAVWYVLHSRKSSEWAGTKDYVIGIWPGFDPTDVQCVHGQAVPRLMLSNVDVLTPTKSSQGLLPDMGRK